ncbi:glycosyltransferase [Candidatus Zixiibacteriota bacterium]
MMKIASVGPAPPWRGGISQYHYALADQLGREGTGIEVLNFARLYPRLFFPGSSPTDTSVGALPVLGEAILRPLWPPSWNESARRVIEFDPDAVLLHWWHPFFAPSYLGLLRRIPRKIPVGIICHNIFSHEKMPGGRHLTAKMMRRGDFFIAGGEEMAEEIRTLNPRAAIEVVAHPRYDLPFTRQLPDRKVARRELGLDSEGVIFLYFGLVREYKGLGVLLEALSLLESGSRWTCLIAGEFYEPREPYDALIREYGLEDRVIIYDRYIPNSEVPGLFAAADLTVLPYRHVTQSGVAALSIACHRPVLTTRVGSLPETIVEGENGWLVPPDDPVALAAVLREISRDRQSASLPVTKGYSGLPDWEFLAHVVLQLAGSAGGS